MLESKFQGSLIKEIKTRLPMAMVLKNDPTYIQGIPDLTILFGESWATLEVKKSSREPYQPNQEWYINNMNKMSFSTTIFPENKDEVLDALVAYFRRR